MPQASKKYTVSVISTQDGRCLHYRECDMKPDIEPWQTHVRVRFYSGEEWYIPSTATLTVVPK